jgi:hypothetical protein
VGKKLNALLFIAVVMYRWKLIKLQAFWFNLDL